MESIDDLDEYFKTANLPKEPIQLGDGVKVVDCEKMAKSHIEVLRRNSGKWRFLPYYERLLTLKNTLEQNGKAKIKSK